VPTIATKRPQPNGSVRTTESFLNQQSPGLPWKTTIKESLWSVSELIESVHDQIGIPIVYDRLHHKFTGQNLSHKEAVIAAAETWDQRPIIHYSESRQEHGDEDARPQSHSDYVDGLIETYGSDADVMIEAKKKEKAVLRYREKNEDY